MLLPDNQLMNWPYLAVSGDKQGGLWFVSRTTPNGFSNVCGNNCTCKQPSSNVQTYWTGTPYHGFTIHGDPAFLGVRSHHSFPGLYLHCLRGVAGRPTGSASAVC